MYFAPCISISSFEYMLSIILEKMQFFSFLKTVHNFRKLNMFTNFPMHKDSLLMTSKYHHRSIFLDFAYCALWSWEHAMKRSGNF